MASYIELYNRYEQMKREGKDSGNSKKAAKTLKQLQSSPEHEIVKTLMRSLTTLDRQINKLTPHLALTEDEINAYMEKAIAEIEPWYQTKVAQIEKGVQEGKVRTAEDTLIAMRDVEQEISGLLQSYDLEQAQTEEEFVDRISSLTSRTGDDLEKKKFEWGQRIENVKLGQIQKGIFSSGIGAKARGIEEERRDLDVGAIERRSQEERTGLEREQKYDLERIKLARQSAEQERVRRIGTPVGAEETRGAARDTLGLGLGETLGSEEELLRQRGERGITPLRDAGTRLSTLEEQRGERVLSRSGEYEKDELAIRDAEYTAQRKKILAEQAKKEKSLSSYGF